MQLVIVKVNPQPRCHGSAKALSHSTRCRWLFAPMSPTGSSAMASCQQWPPLAGWVSIPVVSHQLSPLPSSGFQDVGKLLICHVQLSGKSRPLQSRGLSHCAVPHIIH